MNVSHIINVWMANISTGIVFNAKNARMVVNSAQIRLIIALPVNLITSTLVTILVKEHVKITNL